MLVRPRFLYIVPMSEGNIEALESTAESLHEQFGLDVRITPNKGPPLYALDPARKQFNSNLILKDLLQACPSDALRILGVTDFDLFSPIFSFVFGEAQFGGRGAVVSTFRLQSNSQDQPLGCPTLLDRLEKEMMHEIGHTFHLRHCSDPDCVMNYSTGVQCADRKFAYFCGTCRDLMLWHMAADLFLKV
jgi:archaemetzincin